MRPFLLTLCLAIFLLTTAAAVPPRRRAAHRANADSKDQPPPVATDGAESERLRLDRERLDFDRERFKAEATREDQKVDVEKRKVFWSAVATAGPFALGLVAIVVGFWNQSRQNRHQFELKAAEIVFTGTTPQAIHNRGKALRALFGNYLPRDFLANFNPEEYGEYKEPSEEKRFFVEQVLKDSSKKSEIVRLWFHIFPGDYRWLVRVDPEQFKDTDIPQIRSLLEDSGYLQKKEVVPPDKAGVSFKTSLPAPQAYDSLPPWREVTGRYWKKIKPRLSRR